MDSKDPKAEPPKVLSLLCLFLIFQKPEYKFYSIVTSLATFCSNRTEEQQHFSRDRNVLWQKAIQEATKMKKEKWKHQGKRRKNMNNKKYKKLKKNRKKQIRNEARKIFTKKMKEKPFAMKVNEQ